MRINRSTKSDSADLFFDIMSKFNSDRSGLKKEASFVKEASITNLLKALKGGTSPAGKALVQALKSGSSGVDDALEAALRAPAVKSNVMVHGIGHLIGDSLSASRSAWTKIKGSMGTALDSMVDDALKYVDESGNFTQAGEAVLVQSIKDASGVSDKVAKEILDGILSGNAYNPAWKARTLSELGEAATDAAGTGAKGTGAATDAAGTGAKGTGAATDAAGTGAKGTGAATDAAGAASKTDKEIITNIQQALRGAKGATADTLEATIKAIDDALEMTKNLSPEVAEKVSKALKGSKSVLRDQADAATSVRNVIEGNTFSNIRGDINITQARDISNVTLVADKALEKSIRSLGQHRRYITELEEGFSGGRRIVDPPQPTPGVRPDPGTPGVRPDPGTPTPGPGFTGDIAKEIDEAVSRAVKANLEEVTKAVTSGAKRYADSADDIAKQIKELKAAARAGDKAAAEMLEEIAKAQKNFQKVVERALREAIPAAEKAGIKLASETTSVWTKINRFTGWLAKALLIGGGLYGASKLFGDHDGDGIPNYMDDDWRRGGGGGGGTARRTTPPIREQSRTGYRNIKDPKIIEAISSVDPNSPSYDRVNGWKDVNKAIETLKLGGRNRELRALLKVLKTIYDKRYIIELKPPFNVPGESTPLYYAFVNQRRGGPNLSDRTRRTLGLEQMSLNRALQGTDHKGVIKLFDVNNNLMASNAQEAMNETAETSIEKGFSEKGSWFFGVGGGDRRVDDYIAQELVRDSRVREQILQDISSRTASMSRKEEIKKIALLSLEENNARKNKLEEFAKTAYNSTNTNQTIDNQMLKKKADDFSESYYKDATTDLNNNDETLRSYFAGLGRLYDQRLESRKADFKELFNVTDETGEDLIYAAHPKEVVVSDSIGRGGLVENGLEQKRQSHGVALSTPTGNYRANYASRYDALKKISKLSLSS